MALRFKRLRVLFGLIVVLSSTLVVAVANPTVAAAKPPPPEFCVTIDDAGLEVPDDEDPSKIWVCVCRTVMSGIVWCEWEEKEDGDANDAVEANWRITHASTTGGCAVQHAGLSSDYFGSSTNSGYSVIASGRYPCGQGKLYQPAAEIRSRLDIERWNGSAWITILTRGYRYNTSTHSVMNQFANMGTVPDAGSGTYRLEAQGGVYQGGAWRGLVIYTPSIFMN